MQITEEQARALYSASVIRLNELKELYGGSVPWFVEDEVSALKSFIEDFLENYDV